MDYRVECEVIRAALAIVTTEGIPIPLWKAASDFLSGLFSEPLRCLVADSGVLQEKDAKVTEWRDKFDSD